MINKDTTVNSDYQYRGSGLSSNTRFGARKDRSPAVGAGMSITDGSGHLTHFTNPKF